MDNMNISQAAKYVGRTVKTLQRLDREGKLSAGRTITNRRVYNKQQLDDFLGFRKEKKVPTRLIAYCRVSSQAQRPDLKNQRAVMEEFCISSGLSDVEFIEEIGGGMNFKRKKFRDVMDFIGDGEVKILIIAHRDRLCRFGYEWFEYYCKRNGCEILVLNQERLSSEQEMVQDLMTIIHTFSSRLYGLRNYRKSLKKVLNRDFSS